ncbi:MAG: hypothetical protein PHH30_02660, partial [Bacteroidales bacterium]|nr:hypothetical protein [Bacteroidales bacterium]
MKRLILLIASAIISLSAFNQTQIELDFGILQNGSQLLLDSVLIENQTADCDTMIYNSQAGFVFDMISGINPIQSNENDKLIVKQNYPNPFSGETKIEVYVPEYELLVKVFDSTGKIVLNEKFNLVKGSYSFTFTPGEAKQYIASF